MNLGKTLGETELITTTQAVVELGELAMIFGRINRTCVVHPTGEPESDTDHTVMLAWVAPSLAEMINLRAGFDRYPVGKVTQYAVVHDAVEVYAGDTPTHKITAEGLAAKQDREYDAAVRLYEQFAKRLPWFARTVRRYEEQADPVARFVRSVDKIMPKVVHVLNAATDLMRAGLSYEDFVALYERQRKQIVEWCPEPLLLQLYDELCGEVGRQYKASLVRPPQPGHLMVVKEGVPSLRNHDGHCLIHCPMQGVFDKWVAWNTLPLHDGEYPLVLGEDGSLVFNGKQD